MQSSYAVASDDDESRYLLTMRLVAIKPPTPGISILQMHKHTAAFLRLKVTSEASTYVIPLKLA